MKEKNSLRKLISENQGKLLVIASALTLTVVALQNLAYLKDAVVNLFHDESDDLIIVDKYVDAHSQRELDFDTSVSIKFKEVTKNTRPSFTSAGNGLKVEEDTLEFRVLNVGEKTIALREAQFIVDSIWRIENSHIYLANGIDEISAQYGANLYDSSKPYISVVKLHQSIKPNESDRFIFKLSGGVRVIDTKLTSQKYFIVFKVKFLLNNADSYIVTEPILHYFYGGHDPEASNCIVAEVESRDKDGYAGEWIKKMCPYEKKSYDNNRQIVRRLYHYKAYKSPEAIAAINRMNKD